MKRVISEQLSPGMVTAEDVYALSGQLLVPKGVALTDSMLSLIYSYSIHSIRIDDSKKAEDIPSFTDIELPDLEIPPEMEISEDPPRMEEAVEVSPADIQVTPADSRASRISADVSKQLEQERKQFRKSYEKSLDSFKTTISDIVSKNSTLDIGDVLQQTLDLLKPNGRSVNIFDMLLHMREYDDSIYSHCINVALLCSVLAGWLQFTETEKILVTACGLFHDIGKMTVPEDILQKPGILTAAERKIVEQHAEQGYQILSRYQIHESIKNTALMHHEKCDGSGYPRRLRGSQVDKYSRLVTICDIYNAMTSERSYRKPYSPFYVIDAFESEGLQKYDTRYILVFLENVVNTYLNCPVRLSNGQEGEVVFINRSRLGKPTVRCGSEFIDLSIRTDLYIDTML